jgi:PAS domain S-box-containing protein
MFRVRDTGVDRRVSYTGRAIELTLLVALMSSLASTGLIVWEYQVLSRALYRAEPLAGKELEKLHRRVTLQLAIGCVVGASLGLGLASTWWLLGRYSSSQRSLLRVKMLAHDILASTDRGVITVDHGGTVTSANSSALRLLNRAGECVGLPVEQLAPIEIPLVEIYRQVSGRRQPVRERDVVFHRDGRRLRFRLDGDMLSDTSGVPLGCVIHIEDTTERMLIEERMRRMERYLGLSTLASGLHHEIKNPLTALSIHVQLLEEALAAPDGAESIAEVVGVLKSEVCRLNGVLENFRSFVHLQRLTLQPTDPVGVVENAVRLVRPQAAEQGVRVTLLRPDTRLPAVPLDRDKFEQAVLNLVINALEAMPSGGDLTISAAVEDGELRVSVTDSGPGIPPEVQPSLFQPYFSTKDRGTGLGLALSEKLIGQHGGRIEFTTGPTGTTFRVGVPLAPPSDPS